MAISLKYAQTVNASAASIYRAFTNATALREWLADVATVDAHPGGRFFLAWNSGYYAAGEYTRLQPDKEVQFIWAGRDDPSPSRVRVAIAPLDNNLCSVVLEHLDLNNQGEWSVSFKKIESGWVLGMRNLVSVLEDGLDQRIINRPMLGIVFGDYEKKHAEELSVPVFEGMRIDSVVEGLGAHNAGLKKNDVIIALDGKPVVDFPGLVANLRGRQAGEKIEISLYRGSEARKVVVELSRRPIPEIPMTPSALSAALAKSYAATCEQLAGMLAGIDDQVASRKPKDGEWNIKEVLAHLIHSERDNQLWINELVFGQERTSDSFTGNLDARVKATSEVFGSAEALLEELRRSQAETAAFIAALPDSFAANKGSFWRMGYQLIEFGVHPKEHAGQISDLLGLKAG